MKDKQPVYIIGAGVSGLIAAYELEQAGHSPVILEQSESVGGRVKTLDEKGFPLDLGFQVLLSAYPLAKQYLDMDALELRKLESGALIYADGKSYRIGDPLRNLGVLIPTMLADIGSISDKLKILKLNQRLKNKSIAEIFETPESTTLEYLQDFGFSSKIIARFFKPFFAGIFLEPELRTSSRMFEFVYRMFGEGYATIPKAGIGAISEQLKTKLKNTEFRFNTEVKTVTSNHISLNSGEQLDHNGVILASNAASLVLGQEIPNIDWKSCMCIYFEVDQTNIPKETIALVSDAGKYSNNLYAYKDLKTGKKILSVTVLEYSEVSKDELIESVVAEVKQYTGAQRVNYIQHYDIVQALPDIHDLKMTMELDKTQVMESVYLAGDAQLNGSLNAAMEAGRIAAQALLSNS
ncbi:protoporphyrinogen/coproporphyrinogen oxidase [Gilvibacter sediminis]|uniref:protoporphyrinogen/coproporphyrinogen oxidase n=1 Tax=Gilvibacter sediminis TaxID=379071 RepID=UPI0023504782|nr:NAD(P)/FAD-dependent oxidoreductase [Gilvibacter sediminis]MDC7998032.1 NAD(P)/FAD-dependent oxidoreductase [Gilvibacter sediminis]